MGCVIKMWQAFPQLGISWAILYNNGNALTQPFKGIEKVLLALFKIDYTIPLQTKGFPPKMYLPATPAYKIFLAEQCKHYKYKNTHPNFQQEI